MSSARLGASLEEAREQEGMPEAGEPRAFKRGPRPIPPSSPGTPTMSASSSTRTAAPGELPLRFSHASPVAAEAPCFKPSGIGRDRLNRTHRETEDGRTLPRAVSGEGTDTLASGDSGEIPHDDFGGPSKEPMSEETLLATLLAASHGVACATALLQHFPSIGHFVSADASQLRSFGLVARDIALLRLVREVACRMAKARVRDRPVLCST